MANVEFRKALALRSEMLISGTRSAVRTHAGQFFPWTFVIHLVHGPHAAACGSTSVPGRGRGVRPCGSARRPELTLLRIVAASGSKFRVLDHDGQSPSRGTLV